MTKIFIICLLSSVFFLLPFFHVIKSKPIYIYIYININIYKPIYTYIYTYININTNIHIHIHIKPSYKTAQSPIKAFWTSPNINKQDNIKRKIKYCFCRWRKSAREKSSALENPCIYCWGKIKKDVILHKHERILKIFSFFKVKKWKNCHFEKWIFFHFDFFIFQNDRLCTYIYLAKNKKSFNVIRTWPHISLLKL